MRVTFPSAKRIAASYAWSVGCWGVMCGLLTVQQNMFEVELKNPEHEFLLFMLLLFRFLDFALLTPIVFWIVGQFPVQRAKPIRGVIAYLAGAAPFLLCYTMVRILVAPVWDVETQRFTRETLSIHNMQGVIFGTFGDQIAVYITIVIAAHAYTYYQQMQHEELERGQLQQALAASELEVLRNQLSPHFLFNTLHGIATLIDSDRALAKAMLIRLSNLLRAALKYGSADLIRLEDEIEFIEAYLELEKMRLGARLETRWHIDENTREMLVPQMTLQPIVENAIRHGIACCRTGGWLEISSKRTDKTLEIEVRNSVGGKEEGGMGVGMSNTKARLRHLYGEEAAFSFVLAGEHTATAKLTLPAFSSHPKPIAREREPGLPLNAAK